MLDLRLVPLCGPSTERVAAVAARKAEQTVGMAVADLDAAGLATVRSFFVEPDHWGQGIGGELLTSLERRAKDLGATRLEAMFEASGPLGPVAERLAERHGWKPSQPRTLVCRASAPRILEAPWMKHRVPEGFELFPWTELRPEEAAQIAETQAQDRWFPESLSPFAGPPFEPLNSLGLRRCGHVVGWMITHRLGKELIRYTSLFVRAEDRALGPGMALLAEAIRRSAEAGVRGGIFGVGMANSAMVRLVERRLSAYLDDRRVLAYVARELKAEK